MHTVHLELHLSISVVRLCSLPIGTVHGCVGRTLTVMNRSQFEEICLLGHSGHPQCPGETELNENDSNL